MAMRLAQIIALLLAPCLPLQAASKTPPNIVIIFCDDLGYADIGSFGAQGYTTPHLDKLASQGTRFTNFHVAQPVCSASRTGLLTGCYPNRVGIHGALSPAARHGIADTETTLAELLKTQGYATCAVGKWHLGSKPQFLPTRHGFDEYLGLPYSNDMWPHHPQAKPGSYPNLPLYKNDKVIDDDVTDEDQNQLTTRYTEHAVGFIERSKNAPFFLYLAHSMPHVPLHVSDKFRGKSQRGLFGDVIEEIDWSVGQVMAALDTSGLAENTFVVFTSDNGPWLSYGDHAGSAGPLREGKGTSWEGGTRVPCLMRWPSRIKAGATSDSMFMTIDLLPTIATLLGAAMPKLKIDGLNVWPIIASEPGAKNPHDAYWFYYEQNQLQSVVTGDGQWKLQLPHTYRAFPQQPKPLGGKPGRYEPITMAEAELYDLVSDIGEKTNVAKQNTAVVKRLHDAAAAARAELGDTLTKREGTGNRKPGLAADLQ